MKPTPPVTVGRDFTEVTFYAVLKLATVDKGFECLSFCSLSCPFRGSRFRLHFKGSDYGLRTVRNSGARVGVPGSRGLKQKQGAGIQSTSRCQTRRMIGTKLKSLAQPLKRIDEWST